MVLTEAGAIEGRSRSSGAGFGVGYFAYAPGVNPYQKLFRAAVSARGFSVETIPPATLFPLRRAARSPSSILQFDWIHDLYIGRNSLAQAVKQLMFIEGLRPLRSKRVVWTIHNMVAHDSSMKSVKHEKLIQRFLDTCDGLLFLSKSSIELFADRYSVPPGVKIGSTRIGHFVDSYPNTASLTAARNKLGLGSGDRVALHFGRLHPYKGVDRLIHAFHRTSTTNDVLVVAGEPASVDFASTLRASAQNTHSSAGRVVLHFGTVKDFDVQWYFNAADFVIFPFEKILNSASIMVAKSFGCPAVAPNLGSLAEYAREDLDILYSPGTPLEDVLRNGFDHFEGDSATDRRPRVARIRQNFSWDAVGDAAAAVYHGVSGAA